MFVWLQITVTPLTVVGCLMSHVQPDTLGIVYQPGDGACMVPQAVTLSPDLWLGCALELGILKTAFMHSKACKAFSRHFCA